jgi:glyoxylate/hydroxypyruvate reductase A
VGSHLPTLGAGTACGDAGHGGTAKDIPDIPTTTDLRAALATAQIVITLLPKTPETENILNAETLALLPQGAVILNPGRGALIDDAALLDALDTGQIGHATLDVFRVEPLPADHPYWTHPKVTVTPHIAADTRPTGAAKMLVENIRRGEAGEPLLNRVDRTLGY